jgi:hypothetical protein
LMKDDKSSPALGESGVDFTKKSTKSRCKMLWKYVESISAAN